MHWVQLTLGRLARQAQRLRRCETGSVALMFSICALPLAMAIGLAIDYGFFIRVKAQLDLAADAAAMHAVRVASQTSGTAGASTSSVQQAGQAAAAQWFAAQAGSPANTAVTSTATVNYIPSPSSFTATVTYTGTVKTYFGGLFNMANFAVAGTATASISTSYLEVLLLLDNSGSMLIGATLADIVALEKATPCSTQGVNEGQNMGNYSWTYTGSYGYGSSSTVPPATTNGACDSRYSGDPSACPYAASLSNLSPGNLYQCTNGGGSPATVKGVIYPNMPNAPCGFACHNNALNKDYFGLARSLSPPVTLRLDVVQQAAADVATTLQSKQQAPGQFSIGVYQFNTSLQQVYPTTGGGEAGTDFSSANTIIQNTKNTPGLTGSSSNTNFHLAATTLNAMVSASGNGVVPSQPQKFLFIVTDGMQDSTTAGVGPMITATNDQYCSLFWNKGFQVYVLYTPYLPLPNPFYLNNDKQYTEPASTGANVVALQACARSSTHFFQASDPTAIGNAMQAMLASALNAAGRVSK